MPSTVCRKYRLDPESKKHVQQQNAAEALDISSFEFYPLLFSSIYPSVAVHVSHNGCRRSKIKPSSVNNHLLSRSTNIICRCQQTVQLPPVPKPIQLKQTISPKTALTRPTNVSKEIIYQLCILCCVLFVVLCIVCCVSQYCVVPTINCKFFQ